MSGRGDTHQNGENPMSETRKALVIIRDHEDIHTIQKQMEKERKDFQDQVHFMVERHFKNIAKNHSDKMSSAWRELERILVEKGYYDSIEEARHRHLQMCHRDGIVYDMGYKEDDDRGMEVQLGIFES